MCRNAHTPNAGMCGGVKFACYETPYSVKGTVKHTGSKQAPKDICTDKIIGTWEAEKPKG